MRRGGVSQVRLRFSPIFLNQVQTDRFEQEDFKNTHLQGRPGSDHNVAALPACVDS